MKTTISLVCRTRHTHTHDLYFLSEHSRQGLTTLPRVVRRNRSHPTQGRPTPRATRTRPPPPRRSRSPPRRRGNPRPSHRHPPPPLPRWWQLPTRRSGRRLSWFHNLLSL